MADSPVFWSKCVEESDALIERSGAVLAACEIGGNGSMQRKTVVGSLVESRNADIERQTVILVPVLNDGGVTVVVGQIECSADSTKGIEAVGCADSRGVGIEVFLS